MNVSNNNAISGNNIIVNVNGGNPPVQEQPKIGDKDVSPADKAKDLSPNQKSENPNPPLENRDVRPLQDPGAKPEGGVPESFDLKDFKLKIEPRNPSGGGGAGEDVLADLFDDLTNEEKALVEQFEVDDFEALLGKVNDGIIKFSHANKNKLTKADYGQNFFTKSFSWRKSANHNYSGARDLKLVRLALFRAIGKRYGFDQETMVKIAKDLKLIADEKKAGGKAGGEVGGEVGGLERLTMKSILEDARRKSFEDMSVLNEFYADAEGNILHATELKKLTADERKAFKPCFSRSPSDVKLLRARMETSVLSKKWSDNGRREVEPAEALQICFGKLTKELKDACTVKGSNPPAYDMTGADMKSLVAGYMREAQNVRTMARIFGEQVKLVRESGDKSTSDVEKAVLGKFATSCTVNDLRSNGSKTVAGDELFRTMFNTLLCAKSTMPKQRDSAGKDEAKLPRMSGSNAKDMEFLYTSILADFVKESGEDLEKGGNERQLINTFYRFSAKLDDYAKAMRADVDGCDRELRRKVSALLDNEKSGNNRISGLTEGQKKEIDGWRQQFVDDYQATWKDCRFGLQEGKDNIGISIQDSTRPGGPGALQQKRAAINKELDERLGLVEVVKCVEKEPGTVKAKMMALLSEKVDVQDNEIFRMGNAKLLNYDKNLLTAQIFDSVMRLSVDALVKPEERDSLADKAVSDLYGSLVAVKDGSLTESYGLYLQSKDFFGSALKAYETAYRGFDPTEIRDAAKRPNVPDAGSLEEKYQNLQFKKAQEKMMKVVADSLKDAKELSNTNSFDVREAFDGIRQELVSAIKGYETRLNGFKVVRERIALDFQLKLKDADSGQRAEGDRRILRNLDSALHDPTFRLNKDDPQRKQIVGKLDEIYGAQLECYMLDQMKDGTPWTQEKAVEDVAEGFLAYVESEKEVGARLDSVGKWVEAGSSQVGKKILWPFEEQYVLQKKKVDELLNAKGDYNDLLRKVLGDEALETIRAVKGDDAGSGFGKLIAGLDLNKLCAHIVRRTYDARIKAVRQLVGTASDDLAAKIEKERETRNVQELPPAEIEKIEEAFVKEKTEALKDVWNSGTKVGGADWETDVGEALKSLKNLKDCLSGLSDHLAQRLQTLGLRIKDVYPKLNNQDLSPDDSFGKMGMFTLNQYLKENGLNTKAEGKEFTFRVAAGDLSAKSEETLRVGDILKEIASALSAAISADFTNFAVNPKLMETNLKLQMDAIITKEVERANSRRLVANAHAFDRSQVIIGILTAFKETKALDSYPFANVYFRLFAHLDGDGVKDVLNLTAGESEMARDLSEMLDNRIKAVLDAYNSSDDPEHPCGCFLNRTDVFKKIAVDIVNDLCKLSNVVAVTTRDSRFLTDEERRKLPQVGEKFEIVHNFVNTSDTFASGFRDELTKFISGNGTIRKAVGGDALQGDMNEVKAQNTWLSYLNLVVFGKDESVNREFFSQGLADYCKASNGFCSKANKVKQVEETVDGKSLTKTTFADFEFDEKAATEGMQAKTYDMLRRKLREYHPQMTAFKETWSKNAKAYEDYINQFLKTEIGVRNKKIAGFGNSYSDSQIAQMARSILEELRVSRMERGLRHDAYIAFDEKPGSKKVVMHKMDDQEFDGKGVPTGRWKETINAMCKAKIDADLGKSKEIRQSVDAFVKMMSAKPKEGGIWFRSPGQKDPVRVCSEEFVNWFVGTEMDLARQKGDAYDADGMVLRLEAAMRKQGIKATRLDFCRANLLQSPALETFRSEVGKLADVVCSQIEKTWASMSLRPGSHAENRQSLVEQAIEPFLEHLIERQLESIATAKDFTAANFSKPATQFKMITDLCDHLGLSYDTSEANLEKCQLVMKAPDGNGGDDFFKRGGRLNQIAQQLLQGAAMYGQRILAYNEENKAKQARIADMSVVMSTLVAKDDFWWALGQTSPVSAVFNDVLAKEQHGFMIAKFDVNKPENAPLDPIYMNANEYYAANWDRFLETNVAQDDIKIDAEQAKVKNTDLGHLLDAE